MLAGFLAERRRNPLSPPDFFQQLCEARYADGSTVPDAVLINMLVFLTWSGHETTTGHLSWALVDLFRHPAELELVLDEQRSVLTGADLTTVSQVGLLKKLDHVLHETERLRSVVFVMLRCATEEIEYSGSCIPEGSLVLVSPWVSHRLATSPGPGVLPA